MIYTLTTLAGLLVSGLVGLIPKSRYDQYVAGGTVGVCIGLMLVACGRYYTSDADDSFSAISELMLAGVTVGVVGFVSAWTLYRVFGQEPKPSAHTIGAAYCPQLY